MTVFRFLTLVLLEEWMPENERFELPSGLNMPDGHPFFANHLHEQNPGYPSDMHPQDDTFFRSTNALTLRIPSQGLPKISTYFFQ